MKYTEKSVENINIAYIGGGSRGWAWTLMNDLVSAEDISGTVALYDIDYEAAQHNEIIGELYNDAPGAKSHWSYKACEKIEDALCGADFVVISILPGSFDEMESDVHTPEKYGIYQTVGDTTGPGGIIRALRTLPMIEHIAKKIEECCPEAWVINYTNPMTVITKMLYKAFPGIKAFGCCHEVFSTQRLLAAVLEETYGIKNITREDIKVNVVGVNHFTWLTDARYQGRDLFPDYKKFVDKHYESGYHAPDDKNWLNKYFACEHRVKFDLFRRYGYIAAAGDRHLAEFCEGQWYLGSPENAASWKFGLTPVSWRKENKAGLLQKSEDLRSGKIKPELIETGEDGVNQIRAILGLCEMVSNVNIPNEGQIPNLPYGAIVETNAVFRDGSVTPVFAGNVPKEIFSLISRALGEQEIIVEAAARRDLDLAFSAFSNNALVNLSLSDARALFDEMVDNTKEYLQEYFR